MTAAIEEYLSVGQVAQILRLSPERVRQLANDKKIPSTKTALGLLFDPIEIERVRVQREEGK